ncbi:MAG: sigma-54 dependent transcriptional regulator [Prolixibacteraceae bacterium]|jgi:DNA-binding NtrC family response regulator|nr:sigma-54 dependent transcriptional regulator [Prolixibacteraceae bacterium]
MDKDKIRVLILDDEKHFTEELAEFLELSGHVVYEANTVADGMAVLDKYPIDLLILDIRLPGADGLDVLKKVKIEWPSLEVIIVSGHGDMETVIKAMRLGAFDYLRKPFRHIDIQIAIERSQKFLILQHKLKTAEEKNSLISKSMEEQINRQFIGVSSAIQKILEQAMMAAQYPDTNVLITGESGTGKENIARIIHYGSSRKKNLFCAVNSSAITDSLLESEFFGHKKGSFTGAISDKKGFFEISDQGTLFLDEIADMPLNLQAKILRSIEEKVVTRVGDTTPIKTDFRIISATNYSLDSMVKEKRFRLDLLHRLNTLQIHIPPLRERTEDIKPLIESFVSEFSIKMNKPIPGISKTLGDELSRYPFPGNIRELRNLVERAIIFSKGDKLSIEDFNIYARPSPPSSLPSIQTLSLSDLQIKEKQFIIDTLKECHFNQTETANRLGISRDALIRKMKKYAISVSKTD